MKKILLFILFTSFVSNTYADREDATAALAAGIVLTAIALSDQCETTDYKNFKPNTLTTALPGNAIVDQKQNACRQEKLILKSPIASSNQNHDIDLKVGDSIFRPEEGRLQSIEIGKDTFGDPLRISVDSSGVVSSHKSIFSAINGKQLFTPRDYILVREETFSQELIYTGISENTVYFLYREFSGSMIRYPFNVELRFDLSKSNIINIKNWSIEIASADNQSIKYTVKE